MAETARLKLPLLAAAQAQKHVTHNEALAILDLLTGVIPVLSRALSAPPGGATDGAVYILSAAGTGGWAGYSAKDIAMMIDGGWRRELPSQGMVAAVANEGGLLVKWDGAAWSAVAGGPATYFDIIAGAAPAAPAAGQARLYVVGTALKLKFSDGSTFTVTLTAG